MGGNHRKLSLLEINYLILHLRPCFKVKLHKCNFKNTCIYWEMCVNVLYKMSETAVHYFKEETKYPVFL